MKDFDKDKLDKEINSFLKKRRLFLILGFSFLGGSFALSIISSILETLYANNSVVLLIDALLLSLASLLFAASITMFILRRALFSTRFYNSRIIVDEVNKTKEEVDDDAATVDVKEMPKSHNEELLEQYENLYKQGLISEEDLNKKREELSK